MLTPVSRHCRIQPNRRRQRDVLKPTAPFPLESLQPAVKGVIVYSRLGAESLAGLLTPPVLLVDFQPFGTNVPLHMSPLKILKLDMG